MKLKICKICHIEKPLSDFYNDDSCEYRVESQCKDCRKQESKIYYDTNKEKKLKKCKEYYEKNKDKILLKQRNNPTRKERNKQYQIEHREELKIYKKEYQQTHKELFKRSRIKHEFGMTIEQYDQILKEQNGVCAICKQPETVTDSRTGLKRALAIDHNHKTGKNRGLLCQHCNVSLGNFNDDVNLLLSAINYLNKCKD